jgi:hypothetical protein
MKNSTSALRINRILSLITFFLGVLLLIFMITVEGELGALPLALTLLGAIWAIVVNYKIKSRSNN